VQLVRVPRGTAGSPSKGPEKKKGRPTPVERPTPWAPATHPFTHTTCFNVYMASTKSRCAARRARKPVRQAQHLRKASNPPWLSARRWRTNPQSGRETLKETRTSVVSYDSPSALVPWQQRKTLQLVQCRPALTKPWPQGEWWQLTLQITQRRVAIRTDINLHRVSERPSHRVKS
jgi:hypothetical protein